MRRTQLLLLATCAFGLVACINVFHKMVVDPLPPATLQPVDTFPSVIKATVKAHLVDGSTVLFLKGAEVIGGQLRGNGLAYPLLSETPHSRTSVPLDSVVGVEAFRDNVLEGTSILVSTAATAVGTLGTVVLLKALFGSCPTVYADTGAGPQLQAEGFSYAIAPLFEQRDVDPLATRPDTDGVLRLELRNEALETHFINQVEILETRHAVGERVVPDQSSNPVTIGALRSLTAATDRAGRDVRDVLSSHDGQLFASAAAVRDRAHAGDLDDWIEFGADSLAAGDSVAIVLRLRNSLLNTVLLYDGMLGGIDAADWMTTQLTHIATAVDMGRWYRRTMGMHASVDGAPGDARLGDVGPIAFRDVAIVLPRAAHNATTVRGRLRFVADNWRIDQVLVAAQVHRARVVHRPVTRVVIPTPQNGGAPATDTGAVAVLAAADDRYLETLPGQRMTLEIPVSPTSASTDSTSSYEIAWQGWYREWVRGSWLANPTRATPFVPGDSAVASALRRWRARQPDLERAFYATRVPVR